METPTNQTIKLEPNNWYLVKIKTHSNPDLLNAEVKARFGGRNFKTLYTGMFIYSNQCEVIRPLKQEEINL